MSTASPSKPIQQLVDFLESLTGRADIDELGRFLTGLDISIKDLEPYKIFGEQTYRRNMIQENQWYELLCICWRSGQRSPIHNHAGSTCGLKIMQGTATETTFDFTPSGQIKAIDSIDCHKGHVCSSQDAEIHQVSNLQATGSELVTLHIYSPPLRQMDTYSLMGQDTEIYRPTNQMVSCHVGDCI
ncbi:MAG: cysteine dioxygenase family protein [Mariniblastus sp.]|nr:cysteine dioxygenase family protein [Mariniblastus sp.]